MTHDAPAVHTIVKVGGGLLGKAGALELVIEALTAFAPRRRLAIVPGGGPFADAVRQMFRRIKIGEDAAHWMAVLGMDQYAHALAARMPNAVLVDAPEAIVAAVNAGRLPIVAPYRWLRGADPLPHSWDVTSDSIAAWIAGQVGARRVVLVKPPGVLRSAVDESDLVDPYFSRAISTGIEVAILGAHQNDGLCRVLEGPV